MLDLPSMRAFVRVFAATLVFCCLADYAQAVDGCKVMLCLAGNWSNISACRPDVEQALRDVALGRGLPTCGMASSSSVASNLQPLSEASCPPFYGSYGGDASGYQGCAFAFIVSLRVNGQPWSDMYFNLTGSTSTRYYDQARSALGSNVDPRFDADAAAYAAALPGDGNPPPAICTGDGC